LVGMALGGSVRSARLRRELANRGTPLSSAAYAHTRLKDKHIDPEGVKHELEFAERQLDAIRSAVARARQQADDLDREHAQLLQEIEVRSQEVQQDRCLLEARREMAETAQEGMRADIDLGGQEIEELERMRDT